VFDKAVAGVRRLVEAGLYTTLSMVYTRHNTADFEPYLDLALELGVDEARFIPMRIIGKGLEHRSASPDQLQAFTRLVEVLERRPELTGLLKRDWFSITMTVCRFSSPRTGCGIGRKVVFVDADGTLYPCPNHVRPEHACGSLERTPLADLVLRSEVMTRLRDLYQVSRYAGCTTCAFRHWCAGDCRGEVLAATSDPLAPSPHCEELKEVMRRMLWLIASGRTGLGASKTLADGRRPEDLYQV
jgi:radical SAM protein with 4Fe4S-binding SPASM domain